MEKTKDDKMIEKQFTTLVAKQCRAYSRIIKTQIQYFFF